MTKSAADLLLDNIIKLRLKYTVDMAALELLINKLLVDSDIQRSDIPEITSRIKRKLQNQSNDLLTNMIIIQIEEMIYITIENMIEEAKMITLEQAFLVLEVIRQKAIHNIKL